MSSYGKSNTKGRDDPFGVLMQITSQLGAPPFIEIIDTGSNGNPIIGERFAGVMAFSSSASSGKMTIERPTESQVRHSLQLSTDDLTTLQWQQQCDLSRASCEVQLIRVDPTFMREQGRGGILYRNFLLWCHHAEMKRITLDASKENGGYWWARQGFYPNDADWNGVLKPVIKQRLSDYGKEYRDDILFLIGCGPSALPEIASSAFGKSLLAETNWRGYMDFSDDKQYKRVMNHVFHNT